MALPGSRTALADISVCSVCNISGRASSHRAAWEHPQRAAFKMMQASARRWSNVMAKYGKKSQSAVKKTMHERKKGELRSGKSGKKVKSRKQAIAIGLSKARRAGAKVPAKKKASKSPSRKSS